MEEIINHLNRLSIKGDLFYSDKSDKVYYLTYKDVNWTFYEHKDNSVTICNIFGCFFVTKETKINFSDSYIRFTNKDGNVLWFFSQNQY